MPLCRCYTRSVSATIFSAKPPSQEGRSWQIRPGGRRYWGSPVIISTLQVSAVSGVSQCLPEIASGVKDKGGDDKIIGMLDVTLIFNVVLDVKCFEDHFTGLPGKNILCLFKEPSRYVRISIGRKTLFDVAQDCFGGPSSTGAYPSF